MITVKSKDGTVTRCVIHEFTYSGNFMGERSVSATYNSNFPIDFAIFDYIEYRGERFELDYKPTDNKNASSGSYGDAFVYELTFVSLKYELERCQFRDLVPNDNGIVYATPLNIEFTGKVNYLTERLQACLDTLYTGDKKWTIIITDGVDSVEKNISISNSNCWDVLSLVNTEYDLNFTVVGRTVTIGNTLPAINHVFEYGKGKGMYEIKRTAENETGIVTRLRAYGGINNLDSGYLKDKDEWPNTIVPLSQYLPNIMLPGYDTTLIDYIDSESISEYGIREASITYEDIYPSIIGATNRKGQRIDYLASAERITNDNQTTFKITTHDLEFEKDFEAYLTNEPATISMRSGSLMGYGFQIVENGIKKLSTGGYEFTLSRNTSDDYTVPNQSINLSEGDEFVFLNITMPKKYILSAQDRLLSRAKEYLAEYDHTNYGYTIGLDELFIARNNSIYENVREGNKLVINDTDLKIDNESIIIQALTIKEGTGLIPVYEVTLNNKPSSSTLNRIQGAVSKLESTVTNSFSNIKGITAQYHQKLDKYVFYKAFNLHENEDGSLKSIEALSDFWTKFGVTSLGVGSSPGGGSGGASTFGELLNVGEWADKAYGYDIIAYKPANDTFWREKKLSDLVGLDETALAKYLTDNAYATQSWVTAQITGSSYTLPTASTTVLGGVKIGDNINITNGIISTHAPFELTREKIVSALKDENGLIYLDADFAVSGGVAALRAGEGVNLPSIYDGLPIDGVTIYWENGILKAQGGGGLDETELANYLTEHNYYHAGNINVMTTDTNQQVTGRKDFYNSIYLYNANAVNSQTSTANGTVMRNLIMTDSSLNNVFSDVKNPTILRGTQIKFQNVNGTDLININSSQTNFYSNVINRSGNFIESEGWFQNDYNGKGLYNSVGNAHFYYESTFGGFKSDKPLYATGKMQVGNDIVLHTGNYQNYPTNKVGDGSLYLYATANNEINFGGNNASNGNIHFGYRAIDSKAIPSTFIFGGANGSSKLLASSYSARGYEIVLNPGSDYWYRCFSSSGNNASGLNDVILMIGRNYSSPQNEHYTFSISVGYDGNINVTQLSGAKGVGLFQKIRVVWKNSDTFYIDVFYKGTSTAYNNTMWVSGMGDGTFSAIRNVTIPSGWTSSEYTISDGFRTNGLIATTGEIHATGDIKTPVWMYAARYTSANGSSNMYIGNNNNSGWVGIQDMCSATNIGTPDANWSVRVSGSARFKDITFSGSSGYIRNYINNQVFACNNGNDVWVGGSQIQKVYIQTSSGYAQEITGLDTTFNGTVKTHQYSTQYFPAFISENTAITGTDPDYRWTIYHAKSNVRRGLSFWSYDANGTVFNEVMTLSSYGGNMLYVNGNIIANGGVTALGTSSSDKSLKDVKSYHVDSLSLIRKIGYTVAWKWNDYAKTINENFDDKIHYGHIANMFEKDHELNGFILKGLYPGTNLLGLNYDELGKLNTGAIFQLDEKQRKANMITSLILEIMSNYNLNNTDRNKLSKAINLMKEVMI